MYVENALANDLAVQVVIQSQKKLGNSNCEQQKEAFINLLNLE